MSYSRWRRLSSLELVGSSDRLLLVCPSTSSLALGSPDVPAQVHAEITAYSHLTTELHLDSTNALNYIWWDTLQSAAQLPGAPSKEFLVGLDPAAYIKGGTGR